jgi:hypothetical protein
MMNSWLKHIAICDKILYPTSILVKNMWIYISTPPYIFMAQCLIGKAHGILYLNILSYIICNICRQGYVKLHKVNSQLSSAHASEILMQPAKISKKMYHLYIVTSKTKL